MVNPMRTRSLLFIMLICILLVATPIWSAVDSSWYAITFGNYGTWLYNNSQDLSWSGNTGSYLDFGQLEVRRNNWNPEYTAAHENLTVRFSTPEAMQLINVDDTTKRFDYSLKIENSGAVSDTHQITQSRYAFAIKAGLSESTLSKFFIMVDPQPLADSTYNGTYASPLLFEVFDKDGDLLESNQYTIIMYYQQKSRPGNQAVHLFLVEQFPTADGIDVVYLMQHPYDILEVGAATFISTDWKQNTSYRVDVSPHPSQGTKFQFVRTDGGNETIPFKVTTSKDPSTMYTGAFSVPITNRGVSGYWQERMEIGIRGVNYEGLPLKGGDYTSMIVLSLFQN